MAQTTQKPLRIGLIGAGRIGQIHSRSISALPEAELVHVSDPSAEMAETLAAQHSEPTVSHDPSEVFSDDAVDAVVIGSPTNTHVQLLDAAVDAGKPALCEKPIDLDIERVDAIRDKVNSSQVPITLGFNRRFDPNHKLAQQRAHAGEVGNIEQVQITSRDPEPPPSGYIAVSGGIFRDMTIHDFDMARFFLPDIVSVHAVGFNQFSSGIREADDFDAAITVLTTADAQSVTITNSRHCAFGYDQRLEIFGSEAMLDVPNVGDTTVRLHGSSSVEARPPYQRFIQERYPDSYRIELAEFVRLARGEDQETLACPSFDDGRAALVLANAAEASARSGRVVDVDLS